MTIIHNCAGCADHNEYLVARNCNGEWWFWGAWDDLLEAVDCARFIGGEVFATDEVEMR